MTAATRRARSARTVVSREGEPVTLASAAEVRALFTLNNPPGWGYGTELTDALEAQPQPTIRITDADATTHATQLAVGALLSVRGTTYAVAEPPEPDGHGLTTVHLAHRQPQDAADSGADEWRWR